MYLIQTYEYRKVWGEGLEVAMKIKGAQGKPHVKWLRAKHLFIAIGAQPEVHANYNSLRQD